MRAHKLMLVPVVVGFLNLGLNDTLSTAANFRAHVATGLAPAAQPRHASIALLPTIEFA